MDGNGKKDDKKLRSILNYEQWDMYLGWDKYFCLPDSEWFKIIDEKTVDDAIMALCLDPDDMCVLNKTQEEASLKECLWHELALIVYSFGRPPPTDLGASNDKLKDYTRKVQKLLTNASNVLGDMKANSTSSKALNTKETYVSCAIRKKSKELFDLDFNTAITDTIQNLNKLIASTDEVFNEYFSSSKGQGAQESREGQLVLALCFIYKAYTGKSAMAWKSSVNANGDYSFSGGILFFLQVVLTGVHTYRGSLSDEALHKKIDRLKRTRKYPDLWRDSKL